MLNLLIELNTEGRYRQQLININKSDKTLHNYTHFLSQFSTLHFTAQNIKHAVEIRRTFWSEYGVKKRGLNSSDVEKQVVKVILRQTWDRIAPHTNAVGKRFLSPVPTSNNVEATFVECYKLNDSFDNVETNFVSTLLKGRNFVRNCCRNRQHCCQKSATMLKQHSTLSKGRNFNIESFDIVAVCGNKVQCCFDKVERCFDIVASVDATLCAPRGSASEQYSADTSPNYGVRVLFLGMRVIGWRNLTLHADALLWRSLLTMGRYFPRRLPLLFGGSAPSITTAVFAQLTVKRPYTLQWPSCSPCRPKNALSLWDRTPI